MLENVYYEAVVLSERSEDEETEKQDNSWSN